MNHGNRAKWRPCIKKERRSNLDASSRILSELASREQALDQQIEAARLEAAREVEAAEAEAARIMRQAEADLQSMQAEFEQVLARQSAEIRGQAQTEAQSEVHAAQTRSEGKLAQAVETILRAVLP